ncbi:MAG: hypothetical protein R3C01_01755 [Planctomycetaceae bacterium]
MLTSLISDSSLLAYLDPGSGSLLLQALVGGGAGLMVFFRHMWQKWRLSHHHDSRS